MLLIRLYSYLWWNITFSVKSQDLRSLGKWAKSDKTPFSSVPSKLSYFLRLDRPKKSFPNWAETEQIMTPRVGDSFNGIKVLKMSSEGGVYNCTFVIIQFNCYHWGYWREKWLVHRHQLFHKQIQILFVLARRSRWMNIAHSNYHKKNECSLFTWT